MTQQSYYATYQPVKKKKKFPSWAWAIIILLALAILIGVLALAVNRKNDSGPTALAGGQDYVAVLYVEGTMVSDPSYAGLYGADGYDQEFLISSIEDLTEDESNRALLLYIDSPGGEIMAASDLSDAVVAYKEATGRPVYAYGHDYAASGGYWLAAAADRFFVNRYCLTGSIGVTTGSFLDFSGLLEKYGVKVNTITSGAQKAMGSSLEEMSPETRAIFQAYIDEYYGYFLDWICEQRGMDRAKLQPLADGRIYTATQAVDNGLADEVGKYEDCLAALLDQVGDVEVVELEPPVTMNWFSLMGSSNVRQDLNALLELTYPTSPLVYYSGN